MDTHITIDGNAITGALPLCDAGDGSVGQNVLAYRRLSTTTGNRTIVSSPIMCTLKGLRLGIITDTMSWQLDLLIVYAKVVGKMLSAILYLS